MDFFFIGRYKQLLTSKDFWYIYVKVLENMSKEKQRTYNQWFSSKHQRTFYFDTPQTRKNVFPYKQCRGEYDEEKHITLINYFTPSLLEERKAQIQLQRYVREKTHSAKCLVTVDNVYENLNAKVQCFFLSQYEPKPEIMSDLEQRIIQLGETAPIVLEKVDNPYVRKVLKKKGYDIDDEETE